MLILNKSMNPHNNGGIPQKQFLASHSIIRKGMSNVMAIEREEMEGDTII